MCVCGGRGGGVVCVSTEQILKVFFVPNVSRYNLVEHRDMYFRKMDQYRSIFEKSNLYFQEWKKKESLYSP